jgi:cyclopropane-fatty-acyl-phospholipid synthase
VAGQLAELIETVVGAPPPIRIRAWDGSEAGVTGPDVPVVIVRSSRALRRLLFCPGELGLARAFVSGDLDFEGDLADGLRRFRRLAQGRPPVRVGVAQRWGSLRLGLRLGALGTPPRPPRSEARLSGKLHTRPRDREAIAHHYDFGNNFYQLLLDPRMVYSCAYWAQPPGEKPGYGLVEAQRDKLDLVCRKLELAGGSRLLDVGCGWSSLIVHAGSDYQARATGVTLSAQQRAFGRERINDLGLADRVEARLLDYRELTAGGLDSGFDAVSSLEMGEHVGERDYPTYARTLFQMVRPGGRLLLQQMSRGAGGADASPGGGPFIERYIAPDMHMRPLGDTVALVERAGFEVRDVQAMREHYVWTVRCWLDTLHERREEVVALVGDEQYRVWQLYLTGAALAFEENRMGVHQILAVRPD